MRVFILKREEVAGDWRRLHNEEFRNVYRSPNIPVITTRRVRWAGHVARIMMRDTYKID
jgi:hypothetical protein